MKHESWHVKNYRHKQLTNVRQCSRVIVHEEPEISRLASRYLARSSYMWEITARPRQLSVTESVALPPQLTGGHLSNPAKFDLREWLVPPVLLPIFLGLLIAAAIILRW
jgi:hypothetical protein